jgi:hypothetical protein
MFHPKNIRIGLFYADILMYPFLREVTVFLDIPADWLSGLKTVRRGC